MATNQFTSTKVGSEMQSTGIKPAQLLMEVIAGAQDKIGQDISKSGFSQQLSEQNQLVQTPPFGQTVRMMDQSSTSQISSSTSTGSPSESSLAGSVPLIEQNTKGNGTTPSHLLPSASAGNMAKTQWKVAQRLAFTDPMALEKVLVDLHLAPSARTEIQNAFDDRSQISLQKLNEILNRVVSRRTESAPDGRVSIDRIQALLEGILQQKEVSAQNLTQLGIRLNGSYNLEEFRQLLQRLISKTTSRELERSAKLSQQLTPEMSSTTGRPVADSPFNSRTKLPNQTLALASNLIPSFLREKQDFLQNASGRATIGSSSDLNAEEIRKISVQAVDGTEQNERFLGDQELRQFIESAVSMGTNVASASLTSIISAAGGLQRISPAMISEAFLGAVSEIIPEAPLDTLASLPETPQSTKAQENNPPTAATSSQDLGSSFTQIAHQEATSAPANLSSSGEMVARSLRMGPAENGLDSRSNMVEAILADRSHTQGVERIAAPANTDFTPNQSGSFGNGPFGPNDGSMSSDQYTAQPSNILSDHLSLNELSGRPLDLKDEIFRDVIRYQIQSSTTEMRQEGNLNVSLDREPIVGEVRASFQNSVELLARSEATGEGTGDKTGPTPRASAEQASQSSLLETSAKEIPTEKGEAKVPLATNTSGQFTRGEPDQEGALFFYKDHVQMASAATAPSSQSTMGMSSYFTSALTVELAQRIKELHIQKRFQFTMELEPRHLGRLVVRIGTDAKLVKALITTESEQARELLKQSSSQLQDELASQGLVLEQLQIDVNSQANAHDHLFQRHRARNRRQSSSQQPVTAGREPTEPGVRRTQISQGDTLISLFV